jgi:hypothetical protein
MSDEYQVRIRRAGVPDKFYGKKDLDRASEMLDRWRTDQESGYLRGSNATAELTIETRKVSPWIPMTVAILDE